VGCGASLTTDEYLTILDRAWTSAEPFSFEGAHYRFENFVSDVHPHQQPRIPIYFGGSSEAAYRVGGKHADVYALWGEPLAETAEQIVAIRAEAARFGRSPRFSVSFRPILGSTEAFAWERAERILSSVQSNVKTRNGQFAPTNLRYSPDRRPENAGSQRLLAAAAAGERHDRALWTPLAAATGAAGNSTALVGTPETVAQAILDYIDIGVSTILIRGYDPYDDAIDYGRQLLPLVRAEVARREPQAVAA
jgi:alkanesulfonate monooxygenase